MNRYEKELKKMMKDPDFAWWCSASLALIMSQKGNFDPKKLKSFDLRFNPVRIGYSGEFGIYPPGTEYLHGLLKEEMEQAML